MFGPPLRRATGFVQDPRPVGLGWMVPDVGTNCRRPGTLDGCLAYRCGIYPLDLLITAAASGPRVKGNAMPASSPLIETAFRLPGNGWR